MPFSAHISVNIREWVQISKIELTGFQPNESVSGF